MPGLRESRRWRVVPRDPAVESTLVRELGVSPLVARVLVSRGVATVADARDFLAPSLARDWADPLCIPGMGEAADRVERALRAGEQIVVFGDFDVDGLSATCLLTLALRRLGGHAHPFIPRRFGEGYGLSKAAFDRVLGSCRPDLVVTVDNGISAAEEVSVLRAQGIDVVVTDHHEPGQDVPTGVPVADPKVVGACPSRELAGAGVALKLVCVLGARMGMPDLWLDYLDVATLGTLSDMMLLTGENRALVSAGIVQMRRTSRPGLVALAATAGQDLAQVTADSLPFSLIPRLNAAGRMGTTEVALDLLLTEDPAEAAVLAGRLEETNTERRQIEAALTEEALAKVRETYDGGRVIVVGGEGWHEGVKGIVASRITNRYHVPCILFTIADGMARGSGRSVGSVDLFHAVEQCADVLVRFGGHAGAVGVTCEAARLDEFRDRLSAVLAELPAEQFEDRGEVAAIVGLGEISVASLDELERLQPFGQGNKRPLLAARGVCMRDRARVGADGSHLRFYATDGVSGVPAIMFRAPDIERAADCDGAVDLVFEAVCETWQGRTKAKLMVRDILYRDGHATPQETEGNKGAKDPRGTGDKGLPTALPAKPSGASVVDEVFSQAEECLQEKDAYAGVAREERFNTKVVGVSFEGRQEVVRRLEVGQTLLVSHDATNPVDPDALAVITREGLQVGYLRRQIASALAVNVAAGVSYTACVTEVTGGGEGRSLGVNVEVARTDARREGPSALPEATGERARLASLDASALTDELRHRMIGDHGLLPAQAAALDALAAGRSCLCVMATGRGKSLIFHIHAAREAIARGRASVFVYPLRALVADQSVHLAEELAPLGIRVEVLTGESADDERTRIFQGLAEGKVDVVLTTPEFLVIHRERFAQTGRVGFVVVDEAHHAGLSKSGARSAYASMPEVLAALGHPVALAVTATAADDVAREVCRLLSISEQDVVKDLSVRANLSLEDDRGLRDRESALTSLVATGDKCVVYVNSRDQSVSLARMLRHRIPELGNRIAFYNAGLTREVRSRVEGAFRSGELTCIVSTSAFGEGVNLPDIRHVVLYHMPFGRVEFNQMSGRAGRDGGPACVHLYFGPRDVRLDERIVAGSAPTRDALAALYRALRAMSRQAGSVGEGSFQVSNAQLAEGALAVDPRCGMDEHSASAGVGIFRELGFLTTSGYGTARRISMVERPDRMALESSVRYLEGIRARQEFKDFSDWVLLCPEEELLAQLNRPIAPGFGTVVDG